MWLDSKGIKYEEIDVQEDPDKRNEFIESIERKERYLMGKSDNNFRRSHRIFTHS